MIEIDTEIPPSKENFDHFLNEIKFSLPEGYLNFMKEANGAEISSDKYYVTLWPLTELFEANTDYEVSKFAPDYFLIGSDGGGNAFAIQKKSGLVYTIPFIGMSNKEASKFSDDFHGFLKKLES